MNAIRAHCGAITLLLVLSLCFADARNFLTNRKSSLKSGRTNMTATKLQNEVSNAISEALGCGGHVSEVELLRIEQELAMAWATLPKNSDGNVERRSLRYAIHRYFNHRSATHIRGFEPSRPAISGWGSDDILSQQVPGYVESVLESSHVLTRGFTLKDAAHMVATIEQLIFDWEGTLLEQIYQDQGKRPSRSLSYYSLLRLLEAYVISWLLRTDANSTVALMSNHTLLMQSVPHWIQVSMHIRGQIRALEYKRRSAPLAARQDNTARKGHNAMYSQFSFEDAHFIISGITQSFASFWDSECSSMKSTLFSWDTHRTGRVPLSKFYGTGMGADWRFGESEVYLRELGALDETSWHGKQVIISNYMQAASNCVVSTPHYLVCCVNDCEPIFREIEEAVGAPSVDPRRLIDIVKEITVQSTLDDDTPPPLKESMLQQLDQIALQHRGQVPLHGRLFAQWLHYAFPRECAFPHKAGTVASVTPHEYGEAFYASPEEMLKHASVNTSDLPSPLSKEDLQWMSQWSPEEELIAEHSIGIDAPWDQRECSSAGLVGAVVLSGMAVLLHMGRPIGTKTSRANFNLPSTVRQHYV